MRIFAEFVIRLNVISPSDPTFFLTSFTVSAENSLFHELEITSDLGHIHSLFLFICVSLIF